MVEANNLLKSMFVDKDSARYRRLYNLHSQGSERLVCESQKRMWFQAATPLFEDGVGLEANP